MNRARESLLGLDPTSNQTAMTSARKPEWKSVNQTLTVAGHRARGPVPGLGGDADRREKERSGVTLNYSSARPARFTELYIAHYAILTLAENAGSSCWQNAANIFPNEFCTLRAQRTEEHQPAEDALWAGPQGVVDGAGARGGGGRRLRLGWAASFF